jgi:hypothetical protein
MVSIAESPLMDEPLTLTDAVYDRISIYPVLRVTVNGKRATLDSYPKPGVHLAGVVFLGPDFEDETPPIVLHPEDEAQTRIEGAIQDVRVWNLYDAFLQATAAGTFVVGPVIIPE